MEHYITLWATVLLVLLSSGLLLPTIKKLRRRGTAKRPDGLYVISEPENGTEVSFEIIAVHGLGAHPEYTWTSLTPSRSSNSEERTRVHLLRDLLKHDFPKARILAFAHNSDWLIDAPVTTAQLIGERLLDGLVKHRRKYRCVPIVFIGHSFGGIIIKEALCKPGKDTKEVVDSTSGIIFLGTPHQGSPMSIFGILAARITSIFGSSLGLLLSLSSHRDKLSDLDERFDECMQMKEGRRQKTKIVAFRETKPTRMFGWLYIGLVVPRDSARGSHGAMTIDVVTDHSGLNKCKTKEDQLYINLKQELNRLRVITTPTLNGNQKFVVGQIRTVAEAAFNSYANEQVATCLKNTRHELLKDIMTWSTNQAGEHVYWLQGKAGTGKSTVARTMATRLSAKHCLAGSFFFKRTESDRSNAGRFFTTIAVQLVERFPSVAEYVRNVIETDPSVPAQSLGEQFRKLIQHPVEAACQTISEPITVVIDALDECEKDHDVITIIKLLMQNDRQPAGPLKFLITSRYEPPIRLGFNDSHGKFVEFPLHAIPTPIIERDITIFLEFRIREIRQQHKIPESWPSHAMLQNLIKKSIPLFIFAATACRFIEDNRQGGGGPEARLQQLLQHEAHGNFDQTYVPALNQMIQGLKDTSRHNAITEFKTIVGSIVTLLSPLSVISLATVLGITVECVDNRLQMLHSVLDIPTDRTAPVRIFHESFREYLLYSGQEDKHPFRVDEKATHKMLMQSCLRLLSENDHLKQDICGLAAPGKTRLAIDKNEVDRCLPPEVQYATLHWVRHLKDSGVKLCDEHQVLQFLQCHFLHWLEALSLIGRISESIRLIDELQSLVKSLHSTKISRFLRDAYRFILSYLSIINQSPLQLYASALVFTPETSIIRTQFQDSSRLLSARTRVEHNWSPCLQTLEFLRESIESIGFSSDGSRVASGSTDGTVKIWDATTGVLQSTLKGHSDQVQSVAFSSDGGLVASASRDGIVKTWDTTTGTLQSTLKCDRYVQNFVFSSDCRRVASTLSDDGTIDIWDTTTATLQSTLKGHSHWIESIAFSNDGGRVASGSTDGTLKLWNVTTGTLQNTLESDSDPARSIAFSSDGRRVASALSNNTINIWNTTTGILQSTLKGHSDWVESIVFSSDGGCIASASADKTVKTWNTTTGALQSTLKGHSDSVQFVAFSSDSRRVASASDDHTIKIWNATTGALQSTLEGHCNPVQFVAFSSDGGRVASKSHGIVKIWDATMDTLQSTPEGHRGFITSIDFSINGGRIASGSNDCTVKIWDATTGTLQSTLKGHSDSVQFVAFSSDSRHVASASDDHTIKIWNATTGALQSTLKGHNRLPHSVAFSSDGRRVVSASYDHTIKIWNATTGALLSTPERHSYSSAVSSDGGRVASKLYDGTINIWNVTTGTLQSTLKCNGHPACIAFSSDGGRVASALYDGTLQIWNATTGALQSTLKVHNGSTHSVAFSSDGERVACALLYGTVKILDATSGALQSTLEGHCGSATLNDYMNVAVPESVGPGMRPIVYGLDEFRSWITLDGSNWLWLPAEYRHSEAVISKSTIVLGCPSGRVRIINLE